MNTSRKTIAFVGFMGAGKTAAARGYAAALGADAVDCDELVERELGEPIGDFWEREGEAAFREVEERVTLAALARGGVVSLGGGAIESEPISEALAAHVCVWCEVDEEVAWERSRETPRPLAADREAFARRYRERLPLYEQSARAILPVGGEEIGREAAPWLALLGDATEMRLAWARSASGSYPAAIGPGAVGLAEGAAASGALPERLFALADTVALDAHGELLPPLAATVPIDASEERKTLAEAERLLGELARAGARRDDAVLAFGGGVVGDLAGFCAATYQRGVPVVQAPTTLVAQVDAAYGGKTGVDLPEAKNYVGAYHLPAAVLADPRTLASLPPAELAAGFAEVVKTALITGGPLWDRVRGLDELDPADLDDVIFACARVKLRVVAEDERDAGRRAVLNLGHTVGHAIEAATGYSRYTHGEAVALGLLAALRLSGAEELRAEVADLLAGHGLPASLDGEVDADAVLAAVERDKKRTAAGVGFVLLERPGEPREGQRVEADRVRAAVEELRSS